MATAMFVETLDNFQHSTQLIPRKPKLHIELQPRKSKDIENFNLFIEQGEQWNTLHSELAPLLCYCVGSSSGFWGTVNFKQ
jgi:hypothetical protein